MDASPERLDHELYLANRSALIDYAARILGSRDVAEDIVQDAYLRFRPGQIERESPGQALAYLYRVVRNLCFDLLKRRRVETRAQEDPPAWTISRELPSPEHSLLYRDGARIAADVLATLDEDIRIAVEMHRLGGYTLEEVASRLGISVATAHRHVRTAMVKIALALDMKDG
ncbi:sigma-70 family RNA polymerase sigma factor [Aquamicrobium sp. LC103]|uniref:RNA polymerase sigma factor n=1 Tax=Aquamicrobium sp. LC103 TaxID=1120658 RepID=UPI00063ECA32|nr:sigma-70 family RNA polymerase sigma factor [Aquamicrobium sp. LC103]TKT77662.1 sigma-70 family RNA polymerase sigma factor [Aquamicrobium sp. LC103]